MPDRSILAGCFPPSERLQFLFSASLRLRDFALFSSGDGFDEEQPYDLRSLGWNPHALLLTKTDASCKQSLAQYHGDLKLLQSLPEKLA